MRIRILSALFVLLCILCVSCSRAEHGADGILAQPYVLADGRMGLSVFFLSDGTDDNSVQMRLTSPSGTLVWNLAASVVDYDGTPYRGSSSAMMPEGGPELEKGDWKLDVIFKDGTVLDRTFSVSYGDVAKALSAYAEGAEEGAFFDENENLTVIGQ
ncbi:MAG: hypothetical protein IJT52_03185 [Spirochaetales bacterium]|nr:hypothetical protein [Spirochaetales bacterium]